MDKMQHPADSGENRREPWTLIPIFGVTQVVNTLVYLLLAVVPFYSAVQGRQAPSDFSSLYAGPLGALMAAGAEFSVSFGRLLGILLLALLAFLIPAGWRKLSHSERLMWLATLAVSLLVYSLTWPESYAIQKWVLA
jgi:hypothetical protein